MIAHSLLIGFIAFDGLVVAGAFSAQDTAGPGLGPVFGNRNFSGFKGAAPGIYQLRIGGPALAAAYAPPPFIPANEWSRSFGNQRAIVTLSLPASAPGFLGYTLLRVDNNNWTLSTFAGGVAADMLVTFSVDALVT